MGEVDRAFITMDCTHMKIAANDSYRHFARPDRARDGQLVKGRLNLVDSVFTEAKNANDIPRLVYVDLKISNYSLEESRYVLNNRYRQE